MASEKKKNERFGKRRTQPVITNCASDLAWLLQRFVFKVRIVWQSYQQGIILFSLSLFLSLSLSPSLSLGFPTCWHACSDWDFMDQVFSLPLTYHLPLRHFLFSWHFSKEWTTWKKQIHTRAKKMMKIIITETKDRTHKQSMRFFCLLFYRKPTLSEVCWASRAPVTSLVTHTRFAVGFTRWHSADRKLQVANRRSISNLYQTQVWYLKISDLGEAEVWYLVVNEWLKVHYVPYQRLRMGRLLGSP